MEAILSGIRWDENLPAGHGWVDVDPTNDLITRDQHFTLAWRRDYADVAPIKGVILGGGEHTVEVTVEVDAVSA